MSKEYYEVGEETDFERLNEQYLKTSSETRPQKTNDNIESGDVAVAIAYDNFKRVEQNSRVQFGIDGTSGEHQGTQIQRLDRIKKELSVFEEELNELVERANESNPSNGNNEQNQLTEIRNMQQNINKILENPDFKRVLNSSRIDDQSKSRLYNITAQTREQAAEVLIKRLQTTSKQPNENSNMTFKLHLDEKTAELKNELRFEDLERRLNNLEKMLGHNKIQEDFVARLDKMNKATEILDEAKIDSFSKKLSSVMNDIENINSRKQSLNINEENLRKLEKLQENLKKVQPTGDEVYQIINRLESLKLIHEESAIVHEKLRNLRDLQSNLNSKLSENKDALEKVSENLNKSLEGMHKNIQNLENRITKL